MRKKEKRYILSFLFLFLGITLTIISISGLISYSDMALRPGGAMAIILINPIFWLLWISVTFIIIGLRYLKIRKVSDSKRNTLTISILLNLLIINIIAVILISFLDYNSPNHYYSFLFYPIFFIAISTVYLLNKFYKSKNKFTMRTNSANDNLSSSSKN